MEDELKNKYSKLYEEIIGDEIKKKDLESRKCIDDLTTALKNKFKQTNKADKNIVNIDLDITNIKFKELKDFKLGKTELIHLVRGVYPYYSVFYLPLVNENGTYNDIHGWKWNDSLKILSEDDLYKLYQICLKSWER